MTTLNKTHIIVDLDGTIAFEDHRRPLIKSLGWSAYFDEHAIANDAPNNELIRLMALMAQQYEVHIITGRMESTKEPTVSWLKYHNVFYTTLAMRPDDMPYPDENTPLGSPDFVSDKELKQSIMADLGLSVDNVLMVFDDRNDMVNWWRENGFTCMQVREQGLFYKPELFMGVE